MMFYALDLETTGLDEKNGDILEVGIAMYDDDFQRVESRSFLVFNEYTFRNIEHKLYDPFIQKMHAKSGLFDDIMVYQNQPGVNASVATVEAQVAQILLFWGVTKRTPMVGSSIAFDRRWLSEHMPMVNDLFSYRSIDASSDMEYLKLKYPALWKRIEDEGHATSNSGASHRVLDDIADTMDLMRRIDKHVYQKAV